MAPSGKTRPEIDPSSPFDTPPPIRQIVSVRIPPAILHRALPLCGVAVLAVCGILAIRSCHPEEATQAGTPTRPASKTGRADPREQLTKWSQRFAEKKPPPPELVRDEAAPAGVLDNGLRYILAPQADQPGEISLRLMVLAGSMHEREGERGLAHFVEHLAFMGRRSRPNGHTLEEFERLGLTSGADSNAHTARDHTLYHLDLPQSDPATLDEAFGFLRDIADGLLFRQEDVDSERRVVLRELEETKGSEPFDLRAAALLPSVPAAKLGPGGSPEDVAQATPQRLRAFWQRNYKTGRMALVATGDFELEAMTRRIRQSFGNLPKLAPEPEADPGNPLDPRGPALAMVPHPSEEGVRLTVAARLPIETEPDSPQFRRRELVRRLCLRLVSDRMKREAERKDAARLPGACGKVELLPRAVWLEAYEMAAPASATRLLTSFLLDFLNARDSGFSDVEFAAARGKLRTALRERFKDRLSGTNESLATLLAGSIRTGRLVESPEDELNRARTDLLSITREECEAMLRDEWRDTSLSILLSGDVDEISASKAQEALDLALATPRAPAPARGEIRPLVLDSFGTPGNVSRRNLDEERGFLEAEFGNGVLVRLQPMPALGGMVSVEVDVGHGMLAAPLEHPGVSTSAMHLLRWYPFGDFNQLELEAAMGDRELSCKADLLVDRLNWSGSTDRENLGTQLEVLCACIARPGLVSRTQKWKPGQRELAVIESRSEDPFSIRFRELTYGYDPRVEWFPRDTMNCDSDMVKEWLGPILARDRLRVRIAGDFAPEEALAALAYTFGALPARTRWTEDSPYTPLPLTPPGQHAAALPDGIDQGLVYLLFPAAAPRNAEEETRHHLLKRLLGIRVAALLRQELGASYSPLSLRRDLPYTPRIWHGLMSLCDPSRVAEVAAHLRTVAEGVRRGEWSGDEYLRACRPVQPSFRKQLRDPDDVIHFLGEVAFLPRLDDLDPARLAAMEPALRQLAAKTLDPAGAVELRGEGESAGEEE